MACSARCCRLPPRARLILTAAIREPSDPMPGNPAVTVTDGTVSGTKVGVPYCAEAGRVLLPVSFGRRRHRRRHRRSGGGRGSGDAHPVG